MHPEPVDQIILTHSSNGKVSLYAQPEQLQGTEREQQLLRQWDVPAHEEFLEQPYIHTLFETQVEHTPDAIAVILGNMHLTYRELNRRANQVARYLHALQIGPEAIVGICTGRSVEMIIGLLGVLKAGAAYLPLDPLYPSERLAFMIEDAGAALLLTRRQVVQKLPEQRVRTIFLDDDWEIISKMSEKNLASGVRTGNLAYVIYTSGSTGSPKGVSVAHFSLVNYSSIFVKKYGLQTTDRVLQFASFSFDTAAEELFPAWICGASVVLRLDDGPISFAAFFALIEEEEVTILDLPTSYWHEWIVELVHAQTPLPASVRWVIVGSEKALPERLALWRKHVGSQVRWSNTYGPTEATIVTTSYEPEDDQQNRDSQTWYSVPIGYPIAHVQVYVLDPLLQPVPIGVPGELYIGGWGLARGYLNRPELTAEKFLPNPFSPEQGGRLYKTGDLVRYQPEGLLEYVGRTDSQVKVRGFRIELGEIEAALIRHPQVRDAVVIALEDSSGERRLVAYIVAESNSTPSGSSLSQFLREHLPAYMIPSGFALLKELPLTPNGKVDRRALLQYRWDYPQRKSSFVAPRNAVEETVASIWAEVLGLKQISIYDNFFDLGGHSLAAIRIIARVRRVLHVELPLQCIFTAPSIADLSCTIEQSRSAGDQQLLSIEPVPRDRELSLSFSQERVWFLRQMYPNNLSYHTQTTHRLKGSLNGAALAQSINAMVLRHEILRTTFSTVGERPVQVIHQTLHLPLPLIDLRTLPSDKREAEARRLIYEEFQKHFDPTRLPLHRWTLLRLHAEEHILVLVEHHLIHDGWSSNVLLDELLALYRAFSVGNPSPLPALRIQFADFAYRQREWMQGEVSEALLAYWKKKLAGSLPLLALPTDHPRPPMPSFRGSAVRVALSSHLHESLNTLCHQEGVTLFIMMLTAFFTLLYRYSEQDDICVGSGVANRRWHETETMLGMVVNNVVLRADLSGDPSFRQLLKEVREVALEAYSHEDLPFHHLVKALHRPRDVSYNPLFQVMFSFHDAPRPNLELPGLTIKLQEALNNGSAKFDLDVVVIPNAKQGSCEEADGASGEIEMVWEYSTDLFDERTISRMVQHYQALLEGILDHPERHLSELVFLTNAERERLLVEWNPPFEGYQRDGCLHQLFEARQEQTPNAVAVAFEEEHLTYEELNRQANQLAHRLRLLGVKPEILVGICMERSLELVVALLGVLKAGGAYVPLDPAYPKERLAFIVQDSQAPVLLTQKHLIEKLPPCPSQILCVDTLLSDKNTEAIHNSINHAGAENIAYTIYTSGSTGYPKGVLIPHWAIVNHSCTIAERYHLQAHDRVLQFASLSFDVAAEELFPSLLSGATVVLRPNQPIATLADFLAWTEREQLTVLNLPTPYWHEWVAELANARAGLPALLRLVIVGSERVLPERWKAWQKQIGDQIQYYNAYGPTEATITATIYDPRIDHAVISSVPIGRPISNIQVYLLDPSLCPVPIGVPGELYIGGAGLARGYLNQPELTAERFIPHPLSSVDGARLYRTGDRARYLGDGTIEFLGRVDQQIKLRGFRIELGEIETILKQQRVVRDAIVLVRDGPQGTSRLVAYVVPREPSVLVDAELRTALKAQLPDYMIPAVFVQLDALPLLPNGKVDRRALLALDEAHPRRVGEEGYLAPRTPIEEALAAIFATVLDIEHIGMHDNFFTLGGDSLLVTRVASRVRATFEVELPLSTFFERPTIAELALLVLQSQRKPPANPIPQIGRTDQAGKEAFGVAVDQLPDKEMDRLLSDLLAENEVIE